MFFALLVLTAKRRPQRVYSRQRAAFKMSSKKVKLAFKSQKLLRSERASNLKNGNWIFGSMKT